MPNHTAVTVEIVGSPDALDQLAELASEGKSILKHFIPLPENAITTHTGLTEDGEPFEYQAFAETRNGGEVDGYNLACNLWGTKWADYDVDLIVDDRSDANPSIKIRCNSAWSPPVEGYRKLTEILPIAVVLSYQDEGYGYVGATSVAGGEIIDEQDYDSTGMDSYNKVRGLGEPPEDQSGDEFLEWMDQMHVLTFELIDLCDLKVSESLSDALAAGSDFVTERNE